MPLSFPIFEYIAFHVVSDPIFWKNVFISMPFWSGLQAEKTTLYRSKATYSTLVTIVAWMREDPSGDTFNKVSVFHCVAERIKGLSVTLSVGGDFINILSRFHFSFHFISLSR